MADKRLALAQKIAQTRQALPFSSSSSMTTPMSSSSSDLGFTPIGGPNTTDKLKSSSMAPQEDSKSKKERTITTGTKSKSKSESKSEEKKTSSEDKTPEETELEKYVLPNRSTLDTPKPEDTYQNPIQDIEVQDQDTEMQSPEEHRSLLQAIMGWDDIPYGRKWNHFIQHGFTGMHGQALDEVVKLAQLENRNPAMRAGSSTYGQELRAKQMHANRIKSEWDKLLAEWNSGKYASGDKFTVEEFFREANRLRQEYAKAGFNPNELRNPSINAGGFQQGFQKDLQADRSKLDWLGGNLQYIQEQVAKDPNWLNSNQAQMYFDKMSEYVILNLAQSKGAIADAEKIRAQVESMPYADRQVYNRFMNMFFNANTISQLEAMSNAGNRDATAALDDFYKFLNLAENGKGEYGTLDEKGNLILGKKAEHYLNGFLFALKIIAGDSNNPININTAVTSYKNAREAFQEYVMQNANVDRQMVWDSALSQYNIYKDQYDRKLPELGLLWGWASKDHNLDSNLGEYLARWQKSQSVSDVMNKATLALGHPPEPVDDPRIKRTGGGAGAKSTTPNHPENAKFNNKTGRWEWKERGQWRFSEI